MSSRSFKGWSKRLLAQVTSLSTIQLEDPSVDDRSFHKEYRYNRHVSSQFAIKTSSIHHEDGDHGLLHTVKVSYTAEGQAVVVGPFVPSIQQGIIQLKISHSGFEVT